MGWEADVPDGLHLSMSRDEDGTAVGLLRDSENRLVGHAKLRWVDDPHVSEHGSRDAELVSSYDADVEGANEPAPDIANLVPIALVALAGIAAGVAGAKISQNRKRRRNEEQLRIAAPTPTPAGWYEVTADAVQLRYWDGYAWTNDYAQRAGAAQAIVADWYPDPSNAAQLRYCDGATWTHHVSPRPGSLTSPADWYPDPSNAAQLRYWDGSAWTNHVAPRQGAPASVQPASIASSASDLAPAAAEPRIAMTTAEWQAHVEAWVRAGAIQQDLWSRLTNARITDADDRTIAGQRQWEALTPQEGARRIKLMLEANPALRSQASLVEFVRLFGQRPNEALVVERGKDGR